MSEGFTCQALPFESIHNLRDLGGLPTMDGRRVRVGRLFRSANPGGVSADEMARLRELGLEVVVDFRSSDEKSAEESDFAEAFNWQALPVLEGSMSLKELVPLLARSTPQEVEGFMRKAYGDFPIRHREAFAAFMREAEAGRTMLFHCTTGKDRTGFAALLLLAALGVPQEIILANYLESNHWNQRLIQAYLARFAQHGVKAELAMPLLEVQASYLQASLDVIGQEWGSVARYVQQALGVDPQRLQTHYLE
jgi:protein-tyrosine phosphatase